MLQVVLGYLGSHISHCEQEASLRWLCVCVCVCECVFVCLHIMCEMCTESAYKYAKVIHL